MIFFNHLKKEKNLVQGVMERKDGSVNPYSNPDSDENILTALAGLGFSNFGIDNLIYAEQLHGANIYNLPVGVGGIIKLGIDGLISHNAGQILIIKTADCAPILIFDPKNQVVAALHCGRKSVIAGIIPKAIFLLKKNYHSAASDILVGIGPHIRKCCYWLREDTLKGLKNSQWSKYFIKKDKKTYFDLTAAIFDQLEAAGLANKQIEDRGICTYDEAERFFSARKREDEPEIYQKEKERFPCFGSFIGIIK